MLPLNELFMLPREDEHRSCDLKRIETPDRCGLALFSFEILKSVATLGARSPTVD